MIPSPYQQAIYDWIEFGTGNALVDAVAGAGKTTTLLEGARRLKTTNACFVAFNKVIAEEIATRLQAIGSVMQASTIHSLGKRCLGKTRVEGNKYAQLCRNYLQGMTELATMLQNTPQTTAIKHLRLLVHFSQLTMTAPTEENLLELIAHYALEELERIIARNGSLWEVIWQGVSVVIEAGKEQYRRERIIDFNDMVCFPTTLGLPTPQFDFLLIDEAQDLNRAQLELVLACKRPQGRVLFVGDRRQCQPAGTMVRLPDGSERPIEEIQSGDLVVGYDRESHMLVKKSKVTDVAVRQYDGWLYTIKTGEKQSQCTDSHKWLVRWCNGGHGAWVTYLMRQGNRYRVGQTRMFLKKRSDRNGNLDFGLASRARQEKADAAWILNIHDSLADALVYEQSVSATYGLPEAGFNESENITWYTQEMLDQLVDALQPQEGRAMMCLENHGRKLEYPLYTRGNGDQQRQGRTPLFETQACNLISGFMAVPVAPDSIQSNRDKSIRRVVAESWQPIEVTSEPFSGLVYSLHVEKYHKYVADGLVTCNSLYGFAGADTDSINVIQRETGATVLPLSICYRCPSLPLELAQQIYAHIQPSPTAERGRVEIIAQADFLRHVQPDTGGCAVIGRCTAPLVALCLKVLQQGKRAKVRGRDIGAGILDIIERLKQSKCFQFATLLQALDEYRDSQLEILGAKPDNELAMDAFLDKVETVVAFYQAYGDEARRQEKLMTIEGFEAYVANFFSDEDEKQCILFSTIHKAKGLEFNVVYVLPDKIPHPLAKNAWQHEQELNAEYVALTRAKQALYFIGKVISNLTLPSHEPTLEPEPAVIAEAEAVVAQYDELYMAPLAQQGAPHEGRKAAGGRPRKQKERLQIKVSHEVAAYLRSLKGGDAEGYSGYLEALIRSDPGFAAFLEHPAISCV